MEEISNKVNKTVIFFYYYFYCFLEFEPAGVSLVLFITEMHSIPEEKVSQVIKNSKC